MSRQILNHFGVVSKSIDGIKFTIWKVTLALDEVKQELDEGEAQLVVLGDAHADFEQDIKHLTSQRENITRNMAQATALEAEVERIRLAITEQVPYQRTFCSLPFSCAFILSESPALRG